MILIDQRILTNWAERVGAQSFALAEQDMRLTYALAGIYGKPELRDWLAFKGGTALNKIYFGEASRLSVDLDFNVVGPRKEAVKQGARIRKAIEAILREQDPAYEFRYDYSAEQTTMTAKYPPFGGGPKQTLKLDISVRESTPILGLVEKDIPSADGSAPIRVRTYTLDELLSSKIRALYGRKKARDAFDLHCAMRMELNKAAIRKLVYYCFYLAGDVFSWRVFEANLMEKAADKLFGEDIGPFLKPGIPFDASSAIADFLTAFDGLSRPDERDLEFLALAKALVGRTISPKKIAKTGHITHPIKHLMGALPISSEAAALTVDDIRPER